MDEPNKAPTGPTLETFYTGWETYQNLLITALTPLTPDQLALSAGNDLRTIEVIARHIVGARARWMHAALNDEAGLEALRHWDASDAPFRSAADLSPGCKRPGAIFGTPWAAGPPPRWPNPSPARGATRPGPTPRSG